ncbi:MAG: tetratricopeptide repeat protein [Myxococcales bacterium]|nr:tetratricopeptide repeat protein [Myxococcales bacterium]
MLLRLLILVLLFTWSPPALACIWDTDTLLAERSRFPTALELMTGKFIRHTPELYAWRLRDRHAKIAADPDDLSLVDDLAVAHDKLGDHAAAIAAMEGILARDPRRYETLANLGTFYLHDGQFERGIEFIDRALEVNPDAHFGRERYQRWLAEYILASRDASGAIVYPLFTRAPHGFEVFLAAKLGVDHLSVADAQAAVKGVLGMMRFGQHDSPILLEALGDLLSAPDNQHDANQLAARAYLLAADAVRDPEAKAHYEAQASAVLSGWRDGGVKELRAALADERAEADAWYAELAARENAWVEGGDDPEAKLAELYAAEPRITGEVPREGASLDAITRRWPLLLGLVAASLVLLVIGRRRARPPSI